MQITVYDKPETLDRYTVVIDNGTRKNFYGMSEHADGFNQFCGDDRDGYKMGRHLGKKVPLESLSKEAQEAIKQRASI